MQFVYHTQSATKSPTLTRTIAGPNSSPRIPRPMNSWMLFRAQKVRELKALDPNARTTQAEISRIVSEMWKNESQEVKQYFQDQAEQCRVEHDIKYPLYKLQPRTKPSKSAVAKRRLSSQSTSSSSTKASASPLPSPTFSVYSSSTTDDYIDQGYFAYTPRQQPVYEGSPADSFDSWSYSTSPTLYEHPQWHAYPSPSTPSAWTPPISWDTSTSVSQLPSPPAVVPSSSMSIPSGVPISPPWEDSSTWAFGVELPPTWGYDAESSSTMLPSHLDESFQLRLPEKFGGPTAQWS